MQVRDGAGWEEAEGGGNRVGEGGEIEQVVPKCVCVEVERCGWAKTDGQERAVMRREPGSGGWQRTDQSTSYRVSVWGRHVSGSCQAWWRWWG